MSAILQLDGVSRSFGGVPVLKAVTLTIQSGATLGLVGENGAGKSTLMNILGGNLRPDRGCLRLAGAEYAPASPADAAKAGIAFVHQELNLFPNLTIAENLYLCRFPRRGRLPWIRQDTLAADTSRLLREVGLGVPPGTLVERLSAGERQLVEIAKALSLDPRLIILDEPTTSLSDREVRRLFALLAQLKARGISMIYISHTLEDVLRLSDQIAVLRDGELVATGQRADFDKDRLVSLMVGRELKQFHPDRRGAGPGEVRAGGVGGGERPVLEVRGVSQPGIVRDISFSLQAGEVLGVSGLMGAGRSELARILFGLDPCERGSIECLGFGICGATPARRIQRGLAFLTEDRRNEGLALEASIAENLALVTLRQHACPILGWLKAETLRGALARIREAVRLTPSAPDDAPARTLSGGNQQKLVLAKWLLAAPKVLLLDEPTRGIDVGAKCEIYQLIHQLADHGAGVLVISSELEELIGICDRILVMRRGELVDELARPDFDRERILRAALHERAVA